MTAAPTPVLPASNEPRPHMSLLEARDWLRQRVDDGERCPCCTQFAKVYKRKVNSGMARSLIAMYRVDPHDWIYLPSQVGARSREEGKLRYWGLIEEASDVTRPDGGRAGYWRLTALGRSWVLRKCSIPKFVRIYDGRALGVPFGPATTIDEALTDKFSYDELMGRV